MIFRPRQYQNELYAGTFTRTKTYPPTRSGFTYTSWQHRLLSYEDNRGEVTLLFCLRYAKFNLVLNFTILLLFSLLSSTTVLDVIVI